MPDSAAITRPTSASPAGQMLMRSRVRGMLYALILTSIALFSMTDGDPTAIVISLIAAGAAWLIFDFARADAPASRSAPANRFFSIFRRTGRGVPKLPLNVVVLIGAAYLCYELFDAWGNRSLIIALGHFIILLLLCKLFEEQSLRDIVQLLVLSLMVVISAAMFSNSGILFTLLLAFYILALAYAVMLIYLGVETQAITRAKTPAALVDPSQIRRVRMDLRFAARNCALLVVPLAILTFCVIPRTRSAGFVTALDVGILQTGYNDSGVQIRSSAQMTTSDAIAMRVKLGSTSEYNVDDLYFRGKVLTEYNPDTTTWQAGPDSMIDPLPKDVKPPQKDRPDNPGTLLQEDYTVLLPLRSRFVQGVIWAQEKDPNYNPRDMTLRDASFGVRSYTVKSPPRSEWAELEYQEPASLKPGLLRPSRIGREQRVFPEVTVDPQVTAMARSLAKEYLPPEGQPVPPESIRQVVNIYETHLRTHYNYSLTFKPVDPKLDPVVDFLLNRQQIGGNCEYFASAMMMLCRAVGLNSRMVSGFHGGEYNVFLGDYALRQKDSHTWVEIFVPDEGWVRSDPTPMSSASGAGADDSIWRWGHQFVQMLQSYWQATVVSFDNDSRQTLWEQFVASFQGIGTLFRALFGLSNGVGFWLRMGVFGPLFALLFLGGWAIRRWRVDRQKMRLIHAPPWRTIVPLSAGIWFVDEMFSILERHGNPRRLDQTPREYVEQFAPRLGTTFIEARWLIGLAYEVRFGKMQLDPHLRTRVQQALRSVKLALAKPAALPVRVP